MAMHSCRGAPATSCAAICTALPGCPYLPAFERPSRSSSRNRLRSTSTRSIESITASFPATALSSSARTAVSMRDVT
eukprot:scaffold36842_cov28-Tisochrysis_lutea.AAC.3